MFFQILNILTLSCMCLSFKIGADIFAEKSFQGVGDIEERQTGNHTHMDGVVIKVEVVSISVFESYGVVLGFSRVCGFIQGWRCI